jgi:hypothetical protein
VGANVTSYPNTGLQSNTPYYYRVRAFNAIGYSGYSNVDFDTTPGPSTICNADFEQGPTCWTEFSTNGYSLITTDFSPNTITPHSGIWAAWLAGALNETSYIQQQVTVPAGSPYLAYWHIIGSEETVCNHDFGRVRVNGTAVDTYGLCNSTETTDWVHHIVNLSAYAGQSISLRIEAQADGANNSNLFVDDVSFQATPLVSESSTGVFDPASALPKIDPSAPR